MRKSQPRFEGVFLLIGPTENMFCASDSREILCNEYHQVSQRPKDLRTDRIVMVFVGTDPLMLVMISPRELSTWFEGVVL